MELKVVDLSENSLKGIGRLLTPEQWELPGKGMEYTYNDIEADLGLPPPCSAGALVSVPRPMVLARLERHLRTREALIALEGEAVFCVAPPQEGANGGLAGITAVRFCAGQALILETGAWHWIPFPVGKKAARFLVVFRSGTGRDDLYYHDLAQGLSLRL
ncbi:MAG: ureidoglycolate lyase [Spirochaetes bacterium]|nr:ureidoglycolate lyase [Spirochaetota bacterium]